MGLSLKKSLASNKVKLLKKLCSIENDNKSRSWLLYIHEYYIKGQNVTCVKETQSMSWILKKIFEQRNNMTNLAWSDLVVNCLFFINRCY